jgi:hypothetical protein
VPWPVVLSVMGIYIFAVFSFCDFFLHQPSSGGSLVISRIYATKGALILTSRLWIIISRWIEGVEIISI